MPRRPHAVWTVYDKLRTARLNVKYYSRRLESIERTNFILEIEFKVDEGLNSGVQLRSQHFDKPTEFEWNGKKVKVPAGRVHGLQAEIDTSARAWSAGLYEEGAQFNVTDDY